MKLQDLNCKTRRNVQLSDTAFTIEQFLVELVYLLNRVAAYCHLLKSFLDTNKARLGVVTIVLSVLKQSLTEVNYLSHQFQLLIGRLIHEAIQVLAYLIKIFIELSRSLEQRSAF